MSYIESRQRLLNWSTNTVGRHDGYTTYADHMTVKFGPTQIDNDLLITKGFVSLRVIGYGADQVCISITAFCCIHLSCLSTVMPLSFSATV